MLSESARVTSAAEARYRVQAPNSAPRNTTVIALDRESEAIVRGLAEVKWNNATFLTSPVGDAAGADLPADGWVTDLAGRRTRVRDHVNTADQVIMVAAAGGRADEAATIGRACSLKRVTTTALLVGADTASDRDLAKTLAQLRPWALMVVIAGTDDYVVDMMAALRV